MDDIDYEQKAVLVRDRKDPRKKEGNLMMVSRLGGAWKIVMAQHVEEHRQDKYGGRIFPYEYTAETRSGSRHVLKAQLRGHACTYDVARRRINLAE